MEERTEKFTEGDFKIFFEFSPDIFCIIDFDFKVVGINPAATKIFGYTIDEVAGRPVFDFLHPEDRKWVLGELENTVRNGLPLQQIEVRAINKSGSVMWTEWTCNPLQAAKLAYCIGRDISATKKIQNALKDREFLLRESQGIAKLGYYEFDVVTGVWESSDILDEIFGISKDFDRSVQGWLDIVHPDDREMMRVYFSEHVLKDRIPFNKEYRIRRKADGQEKWVHGLGRLEYSPGGKLLAMIGTIQDITERKTAEHTLAKNQERLSLALDSAHMGTFEWDIVNNVRYWDSNVHALLGSDPKTFTGKEEDFFNVMHPDDRPKVKADLARALKTGDPYETEYRAVWRDGSVHYVSARGQMFRGPSGHPERMIGVCWDITERKMVEMELKNKYDDLEKHNKLMVGREKRVLELKKEVDDLLKSVDKPPKYGV